MAWRHLGIARKWRNGVKMARKWRRRRRKDQWRCVAAMAAHRK